VTPCRRFAIRAVSRGSHGRVPVEPPLLRIPQFLIGRVDLCHDLGCALLDGFVAAQNVRVMLTREVTPGGLYSLGRGIHGQAENGKRVSLRHP
jgi:hypothetical protein